MPVEWDLVPFEETDLQGSLLVLGMPSVGMVGSIAAGFLVEEHDLRLLAGIHSDALPPVGVVRKGIVSSPIQLWGSELACGIDGRCDRLLVMKSDIPLPPALMGSLAGMITRFALRDKVSLVVGLEGYPGEASDNGRQVVLAASRAAADAVSSIQATPLESAGLTGFAAALLVRANRSGLPAIGLFAPVDEKAGDAAAAARLLEVVDPLLPNIPLKQDELLKRAEELETRIQTEQEAQQRHAKRLQDQVNRGYV